MTKRLVYLSPEEWAEFSADAHMGAFAHVRAPEMDRISFALIVEIDGKPMAFATCRELDAETLYYQHGGVLQANQGNGAECFRTVLEYVRLNYRRITCLIQNTNRAMQIIALKADFTPMGVRYFQGEVFLEYLNEF